MNLFEIVVVAVTVGGAALALTPLFSPRRARSSVARSGLFWFDHSEDYDVAARPSEDANDPPIPWRPLRGRG